MRVDFEKAISYLGSIESFARLRPKTHSQRAQISESANLMKLRTITFTFALALAGSLPLQSATAGTVPFPTDGDVFMGFHSSTATNEYLWDLGQYTQFDGKPIGTISCCSTSRRTWSLSLVPAGRRTSTSSGAALGTLDASSIVFASKAEPSVGVFAQPWNRQSTSSQNITGSNIDSMSFGDFAGQTASPNNPNAVIHSASSSNSWASWNNGSNSPGGSFGTWVPTVEAPQTPGSGTGITASRLDFFHIDPDNGGTNPPSQYIGSFSIDTGGEVTFDVFNPNSTPTPTPTPTVSPTPTPTSTPTPTLAPRRLRLPHPPLLPPSRLRLRPPQPDAHFRPG